MKCTVRAGLKEYFLVLAAVAVAAVFSEIIRFILPSFPIAGDLFMLAVGCVAVYFIYTRYCAEFTYTLGDEGITLLRRIGRRERKAYVKYADICDVSGKKPVKKPTEYESYTKSISRKKGFCYIYSKNSACVTVIEAGDEFTDKLKELSNA